MLIQLFDCPMCGRQLRFSAEFLTVIVKCVCGTRVVPRDRRWRIYILPENPVRYVGRN